MSTELLDNDIEQQLTHLNLLKNDRLNNAAIVLYAKNVEPQYSQCMIKMIRYRGTDTHGGFFDNQCVYGNAFQTIRAAHNFANRHLPIASFFKPDKWQRIDQPAVPQLALREALTNAIIHRDYTYDSLAISLTIFDDRLIVLNTGELPQTLSLHDLKTNHESFPNNITIANVFYQRGWTQSWGTGTVRMADFPIGLFVAFALVIIRFVIKYVLLSFLYHQSGPKTGCRLNDRFHVE